MDPTTCVISTKLVPPRIHQQILQRERLSSVLREVLSHRLTLLQAGAGYGKTTLLASLADLGVAVVWYSLSPTDRDLPVFLSYLVEGITNKFPAFSGPSLRTAINQPELTFDFFLPQFIAELERNVTDEVIVVLDDFHLVSRNKGVTRSLDQFLRYLPDNFHFIVASRSSIQIPCLPRMFATGHVLQIDEADLQFTTDEVRVLFEQVYGLPLGESAVQSLMDQTEGWALGLQLVNHSLKGSNQIGPEGLLTGRGQQKKPLFEYLMEEVLGRQTPKVQHFLKESSILSRFDASSCKSVLGWPGVEKVLAYLERNNLFCVRLDEGFFRYHHLFRDFLRHQCARDGDRFKELHLRAATYFERLGDDEHAIYHYLASQEYPEAVELIGKVAEGMLRTSRFDTLAYWIDQIPQAILVGLPELFVYLGNIHEFQGRWDEALECYDEAGKTYERKGDHVGLSRVLDTKSHLLQWGRVERGRLDELQREALGYLNAEHRKERASLLSHLGLSLYLSGKPQPARRLFKEALDIYQEDNDKEGLLKLYLHLGYYLDFLSGDFVRGLDELGKAVTLAEELNSRHYLADCYNYTAMLLRFAGRHAEAQEYAQRALELSRQIHNLDGEGFALSTLGYIAHTNCEDDLDKASEYYARALKLLQKVGDQRRTVTTLARMASVRRRQGKITEAAALARDAVKLARRIDDQSLMGISLISQGAIRVANGDISAKGPLLEALRIWTRLRAKYYSTCTHFWLAVFRRNTGSGDFLGHLRICLDVSRQNGYDSFFIEESTAAISLLIEAIDSGISAEYAKELLVAASRKPSMPLRTVLARWDLAQRERAFAILRYIEDDNITSIVRGMRNGKREGAGQASIEVSPGQPPPLRIVTLGEFTVYREDQVISEEEWNRKKTKDLFKYLLTERDRWTHREVIFDVLWPHMETRVAVNNFHVTLSHLRQVLEPGRIKGRHSLCILRSEDHYRLNPQCIGWLDVEEFQRKAGSNKTLDEDSVRELEECLRLYKGPYLEQNLYDDWTCLERSRLARLYAAALVKLAKHYEALGDYDKSIEYYSSILAEESCDEEAHRYLMRCFALAGRRDEALRQYEICSAALNDELGVQPLEETVELYRRIACGEKFDFAPVQGDLQRLTRMLHSTPLLLTRPKDAPP